MLSFYFYFDPLHGLVMLPFLLLAAWASFRVKGTFARYNQEPIRSGVSGAEAARMILRGAGIEGVEIAAVPGMLSDHYDPSRRVVALSPEILNGRTPAAVAVAAHEVGHALQHAQGYAPMALRAGLVPVVNLGSMAAFPLIMAGVFFSGATRVGPDGVPHYNWLVWLGIVLFAASVAFHLVTLPVEFDASNRAIRILERSGIVAPDEMPGVRKTLFAAGFTYVAAALAAAMELIYLLWRLGLLGGQDRNRN